MSRFLIYLQAFAFVSFIFGAIATAQESSSSVIGPSAFTGAWEGFDSEGNWLHATFRADRESGPDVLAFGATSRTPTGELTSTEARYRVEPRSAEVASLNLVNGSGTIMVSFFTSDGMRWNWPSGRQAVLTRTLAELPDIPPPSAYQMSFTAPIQARVLSMSGDWYAQAPESALGRAFRITVLDPAAGTLAIRESRPDGPNLAAAETRAAHVSRARQERLSVVFDDTGDQMTLIWTSEAEISLVEGDSEDATQLGRTPPERP